jgi:hypothetical protein
MKTSYALRPLHLRRWAGRLCRDDVRADSAFVDAQAVTVGYIDGILMALEVGNPMMDPLTANV